MESHFLTNFERSQRDVYETAIRMFEAYLQSDSGLSIKEDAYDIHGNRIEELLALHCTNRDDKSMLWQIKNLIG